MAFGEFHHLRLHAALSPRRLLSSLHLGLSVPCNSSLDREDTSIPLPRSSERGEWPFLIPGAATRDLEASLTCEADTRSQCQQRPGAVTAHGKPEGRDAQLATQ